MPEPVKTDINPASGGYSFDQRGCFSVIQETQTNQKFVLFASDCYRYDQIEITDGAFSHEWGQIDGTHCPTDAYAISGSFVTEKRAEGTIKYGYACRITSEAKFIAEIRPGEGTEGGD